MPNAHVAAVAGGLPEDKEFFFAYRQWRRYEGRLLGKKLFLKLGKDAERFIPETVARHFHFPLDRSWEDVEKPPARASAILEAVGVIREQPASLADFAAAEFEPWGECERGFPASEQLRGDTRMPIISARIAWKVVHAPKAELVGRMRTLGKDLGGRIVADLSSPTA